MSGQPTYPDFGVRAGQLPGVSPDMAELAGRIGYPSIRRTGKIVQYTRFDTSLKGWTASQSGTKEIVAGAGVQGAGLVITSGAAAQNCVVFLNHIPLESHTAGLEIMLRPDTDHTNIFVNILMEYSGILQLCYFGLSDAGNIFVRHDAGLETDLAPYRVGLWHNMKMVVDWQKQRYTGLWVDGMYYDLKAWQLLTNPPLGYDNFTCSINLYPPAGQLNRKTTVDYVIYTVDEP